MISPAFLLYDLKYRLQNSQIFQHGTPFIPYQVLRASGKELCGGAGFDGGGAADGAVGGVGAAAGAVAQACRREAAWAADLGPPFGKVVPGSAPG